MIELNKIFWPIRFFHLICLQKTLLSHMHFIKRSFILASFIDAHRSVWFVSISKQIESQLTGLTIRKTKINVPYENGQINVSPTNIGLKLSWSFYTNNNYYNHHRCCVHCISLCIYTWVSGQWSTEQNHVFDTNTQLFPTAYSFFGSIFPDLSLVNSNHVSFEFISSN